MTVLRIHPARHPLALGWQRHRRAVLARFWAGLWPVRIARIAWRMARRSGSPTRKETLMTTQTAPPDPANQNAPDPTDAAIGAAIRAARVFRGLTQGALAEAIGVTFQQVQKYETGRNRVAAARLLAIGRALGVRPGAFFDGLGASDSETRLPELQPDEISHCLVMRRLGPKHRRIVTGLAQGLLSGAGGEAGR